MILSGVDSILNILSINCHLINQITHVDAAFWQSLFFEEKKSLSSTRGRIWKELRNDARGIRGITYFDVNNCYANMMVG